MPRSRHGFRPTSAALLPLAAALLMAEASAAERGVWLLPEAAVDASALAPLRIEFEPDEKVCKAAYGERWIERCSGALGRFGATASGVSISPAVEGRWSWGGPSTLIFEPAQPWPAGKSYTVSLQKLDLGSRTKLTAKTLRVATPPLFLEWSNARFWADPDPKGERWATFECAFSTVPDRAAFERTLKVSATEGVEYADPVFIWDRSGESVYVKIRILALGEDPGHIAVELPGTAARAELKKNRWIVPKGMESARVETGLPSASSVFALTGASVAVVKDASLDRRYEVALRSTLNLLPAEWMKAVEVYELPEKLDPARTEPTRWTDAPVIDDEVLSRAKRLEAKLLGDAAAPTTLLKFAVDAPEGRFIHVRLPSGFGPDEANRLESGWSTTLLLPVRHAELHFLQPGHMLTLSGSRTLALHASGLSRLTWRIGRVRDDFLAMASQRYRAISQPAMDSSVVALSGEAALARSPSGDAQFASIDLAPVVEKLGAGLYSVTLEGWAKDEKGVERMAAAASKALLLTNTALVAKANADGSTDVFAAGFADGKPAANARARLLALNGTTLAEARTDADGRAHFASELGRTREKTPAAILVETDAGDMSWISLLDPSSRSGGAALNAAGRFASTDGLAALVFSQRGVFRAGETLRFGALVKKRDGTSAAQKQPLRLKLSNAAGKTLADERIELDASGLVEWTWKSPASILPGRVRLDLLMPDGRTLLGSTSAQVEDFAPETLAVEPEMPKSEGWLTAEDLTLPVKLTSLYGGAAAGRRIAGSVSLVPVSEARFPGWEGFTFVAPDDLGLPLHLDLSSAETEGDGCARVTLPFGEAGSGLYSASILFEGFEAEGGRAATADRRVYVSKRDTLAGWRLLDTPQSLATLQTGRAAELEFALVDRALAPASDRKVRISISRENWISELTTDASGKLAYHDAVYEEPIGSSDLTTDASGRVRFALDTKEEGRRILRMTDEKGAVLLTLPYAVGGTALAEGLRPSLTPAGVRASLEKSDLASGETAKISVLSPFAGFALAALEGEKVEASKWIPVKAGSNTFEFPIPSGLVGKHYLTLSFVRAQSDAARYLEGYAETVFPLTINLDQHRLDLRIDVEKKADAGRPVEARISAPEAGKAILWAVDEGILGLTDYRTPDPESAILKDRALEVTTLQTLSELMPDAAVAARALPAFGGDAESAAKRAGAAMENPFKRIAEASAVWSSGVVAVGPEAKTFRIELPESFRGKLRLMAVAASHDRVGSGEAAAVVTSPLMADIMAPKAVAPGDRFRIGLTITPDEDVTLPLKGEASLLLPEGFEGAAEPLPFELVSGGVSMSADALAAASPGEAKISLKARAGELSASRTLSLSVRPNAPFDAYVEAGRWSEGSSAEWKLSRSLHPLKSKSEVVVAKSPAAAAALLAQAEPEGFFPRPADRIAAALPYALFSRAPALLPILGEDADAVAKRAAQLRGEALRSIEEASQFRSSPKQAYSLLDAAWALDYLVTTGSDGSVPPELVRSLAAALSRDVRQDPETLDEARTIAYALWVLTREGTLCADRIETLRVVMEERFPDWREDTAALFLAGAYRAMRMTHEADALMKARISSASAGWPWTPESAAAMVAGVLTGEAQWRTTPEAAFWVKLAEDDLMNALKSGSIDAIHRGAAARALLWASDPSEPEEDASEDAAPKLVCTARAAGFEGAQDRALYASGILRLTAPGCTAFRIEVPGGLSGWSWQSLQEGYALDLPNEPVRRGLEIERRYLHADGTPGTEFRTGERVTVEVRIHGQSGLGGALQVPGGVRENDIAVTDLLPGGFEPADPPGTGPAGAGAFERGEDRMHFIVPELRLEDAVFTYDVRAVTPGEFAAPAVRARSIRTPSLEASSADGRIRILAPENEVKAAEPSAP